MPKASPSPPPKEIAHFEIVRRLGAGGMAEVFLAKKRGAEGTYKVLVLKRILPMHGGSRRFRSMFIEEAHLATRLNHPNVVQVYEFQDFAEDGLLLAMEHVEGCDLGRLMAAARAKGTRLAPWIGAWIVAEAAKGLHYAHEKKDEAGQPLEIVHRDVSPQNILLSFEGAVKIADFGIASARLFAEEQGVLKGKFGYMAPEQARGETIDRRSDLYALGVVLWEILAGRPIHGGLGGEALLDIVRSGTIEPPSVCATEVPPELEEIVLRALAPLRHERYPTGREMAAALGQAIFKHGELIDAAALEAAIGLLVSRDARVESETPPSQEPVARGGRSDDARTQAAVPFARSMAESRTNAQPERAPPEEAIEAASLAEGARRLPSVSGAREVRHVSVVTLCLHGLQALALPRRTLDQLRGMLDDLAFKRGMRWVWANDGEARAIAGLTASPGRAAAEAAQLALDVHEAIAGFKEDMPTPVAASLGIVRGIASGTRDAQAHLVDYRLHHPTTHLADALAQSIPMGRTWVAGGIYRLVRRDFRWSDAPILQLEGSAGSEAPPTMRLYSLERSLSREERLAEVQAGTSELVGRDAEKAELHAAYHLAMSAGGGAGHMVCRAVVGEMGIGKTALVAAFVAELPPNARVVHVECTPVGMQVPYATIADLVRAAIGTTGEEPFDEVASLIAGAGGGAASGNGTSPMVARLAELATNRQVAGGDEDAHSRKRNIVAGVRNLLAAVALAQPLVLLAESMHWSDKASLDVWSDLAHASDPLPIFVLIVTRQDERVAHLLEGLTCIELRGLTPEQQVRLVETRLAVRAGAQQVCADLLPKVAGNPFFLLELIDALLERGALEIRERETDEQGERTAILARSERPDAEFRSLPSTLEQLLGDRIRELPLPERTVVEWLAIAGGPLSLADVLRLATESGEEAIVRLCARGLCDRKGELVDFRHALTRDVAYADLGPVDRIRLHRQLGEHLAGTSLARGVSAAIVARHLARGESYERAAEFYFEAAGAARSSHQTRMAIRYFQRSLAHMRLDDSRRVQTHEALEGAYRMLGRKRERIWHLQELRGMVRKVGTPRAICLGLLRTGRYDFDEGRLARGAVVAQRAAQVANASKIASLEVEAEALVSDFLRELGDVRGALAACDRALAACDPATRGNVPPRLQGEVLRSRGILLRRVGRVREAVDAHVDAIAIFKRSGARRGEARVKNSLAYSMFVQGRYEDAIALALESIQIDLSIGGRFQIAKTLTTVGHTYFRLGDVPRALAYLKRARQAHDRYGDQDGWAETLLVSALVATEMGDTVKAESYTRDAGALIAATGNAYDRTYETVVRALLARACRNSQEAADHALAARRNAESMTLVAFHFYAMAIEAASRADLGETHAATFLATTALGAVENLQGCEYGLEIRALCADALERAVSPHAAGARQRTIEHAKLLMGTVRDARLRCLFPQRPLNAALFDTRHVPVAALPVITHSTTSPTAANPGAAEGA